MQRLFFVLIFCVFLLSGSTAQDWIDVHDSSKPIELIGKLKIVPAEEIDSTTLFSGALDSVFIAQPFDLETPDYWGLVNLSVKQPGLYYLSTVNTFNKLTGYLVTSDSVIQTMKTGYDFRLDERTWPRAAATAHIPVQIKKSGRYKLYIRFVTTSPVYREWRNMEKPQLYPEYLFDSYMLNGHLVGGVYMGIALVAFFMNLIWYFLTRNKINLYFVLFVFCGFVYKTATSGYLAEWFFEFNPILPSYLRNLFPSFTTAFYVLFCLRFIESRDRFPNSRKILLGILILYLLLTPYFFLYHPINIHLILRGVFDNFFLIYLTTLVVITFSKKYRYPRLQHTFFSLGVMVYFLGTAFFLVHYVLQLFPGSMVFKFYFSIVTSVRETFLLLGTAYGFVHSEKLLAIENQINTRIRKQNRELERLNQTKQKILSLVTHDVKNPLFSLEVTLEMLKKKEINSEEFDEILKSLEYSVGNTSTMLENVLQWAKSQEMELEPKMASVDLKSLVKASVEQVKPLADNKNIEILVATSSDIAVQADEVMLKSILRNLLTNSIKFSSSGSQINVLFRRSNKLVEVVVVDTGVGMSEEQVLQIFRQEKASMPGTLDESGSGLGLILVQDFVRKLGSELNITSKIGEGSSFSFEIPMTAK